MASAKKNSLDLLRVVAAAFVLYSHQYALLGLAEPSFFGWNTFGGAGVTVFFFLSGVLVWSSWVRDPDLKRFFIRRSLRIFPALWVIVLITIFVLGPVLTTLPFPEYFYSPDTWRYFTTAVLVPRNILPGVFEANPYPHVINGSLWTLPVEFFCYITVAIVGGIWQTRVRGGPVPVLIAAVLLATYGPLLTGARFSSHLEMIAIFWWGAVYGYCEATRGDGSRHPKPMLASIVVAALAFGLLGSRGVERMSMLIFAALAVALAQRTDVGSKLTDRLGDLSYGTYIYAFPVQQIVVAWGGNSGKSTAELFLWAALITFALAYVSWHFVEYQALRLKPISRVAE